MNPMTNLRELKAKIAATTKLKAELRRSDYKIIKAYEYQLANLEPPYDTEELHTIRESIREEIRQLEENK